MQKYLYQPGSMAVCMLCLSVVYYFYSIYKSKSYSQASKAALIDLIHIVLQSQDRGYDEKQASHLFL